MTFNVTNTGSAPITSTSSSPSQGSCGSHTGSMPSCGHDPKGSSSSWSNIADQQCGSIGGGKGGSGAKAGSGKGSKGGSGAKAGSGKKGSKGGSGAKAGSGKGSKRGSGSKSGSGKKGGKSCGC